MEAFGRYFGAARQVAGTAVGACVDSLLFDVAGVVTVHRVGSMQRKMTAAAAGVEVRPPQVKSSRRPFLRWS
jgi:hypothetical protein